MHEYIRFHHLMSGKPVITRATGPSMEPVYADKERITIYPFTEQRPNPVIGDVVHFWDGRGFNRHQVADIFVGRDGQTWIRLVTGDGWHDQFVRRPHIIGYVIPDRMAAAGTEPRDEYADGP